MERAVTAGNKYATLQFDEDAVWLVPIRHPEVAYGAVFHVYVMVTSSKTPKGIQNMLAGEMHRQSERLGAPCFGITIKDGLPVHTYAMSSILKVSEHPIQEDDSTYNLVRVVMREMVSNALCKIIEEILYHFYPGNVYQVEDQWNDGKLLT